MYSVLVSGVCKDFRYKKQLFGYAFYLDEILIGQIFKGNSWTAVSYAPQEMSPVHGFKTRHHASIFLLKQNKYIPMGE